MDVLAIRWAITAVLLAGACLAQDDDLGAPPKLKRGTQTGRRETTKTSESSRPTVPRAAPLPAEPDEAAAIAEAPETPTDPVERARIAAAEFLDSLPNFICRQDVQRQESRERPLLWRTVDRVSADLVFEEGREDYRNIRVNNKPVKSMEESGGAWSTGDFGSTLAMVFSERSAAVFRAAGGDKMNGRAALRYSFAVNQKNSVWDLKPGSGEAIRAGFKGSVWIDEQTGRALRLELEAQLPLNFGFSTAEATVDYGFVKISGQEYLLPTHSEVLMCERAARQCSRNLIDYRDYRRYGGESTISFDEEPAQ